MTATVERTIAKKATLFIDRVDCFSSMMVVCQRCSPMLLKMPRKMRPFSVLPESVECNGLLYLWPIPVAARRERITTSLFHLLPF